MLWSLIRAPPLLLSPDRRPDPAQGKKIPRPVTIECVTGLTYQLEVLHFTLHIAYNMCGTPAPRFLHSFRFIARTDTDARKRLELDAIQ
jgi:hypothetical protein